MVNVFASNVVVRGFEPQPDQSKDYEIGFAAINKHAAWRSNSRDWLARNQDDVPQCTDMSTHGQLF